MPELILRSGKRAGRRIGLPAGDVVIGRDEGCRIRLTSSDVSRRHCVLRCVGEAVTVADLGSRNGTQVNDIPIAGPTTLRPGDVLKVGPFLFQVPPGPGGGKNADEDIAGWLTEEGVESARPPAGVGNDTAYVTGTAPASTDTTELRLGVAGPAAAPAAPPAVEPPAVEPPPSVDPVVAQAAEIIRRHWASKRNAT